MYLKKLKKQYWPRLRVSDNSDKNDKCKKTESKKFDEKIKLKLT